MILDMQQNCTETVNVLFKRLDACTQNDENIEYNALSP